MQFTKVGKMLKLVVATLTVLAAVGPFMQQVRGWPQIHASIMPVPTVDLAANPLHDSHISNQASTCPRCLAAPQDSEGHCLDPRQMQPL